MQSCVLSFVEEDFEDEYDYSGAVPQGPSRNAVQQQYPSTVTEENIYSVNEGTTKKVHLYIETPILEGSRIDESSAFDNSAGQSFGNLSRPTVQIVNQSSPRLNVSRMLLESAAEQDNENTWVSGPQYFMPSSARITAEMALSSSNRVSSPPRPRRSSKVNLLPHFKNLANISTPQREKRASLPSPQCDLSAIAGGTNFRHYAEGLSYNATVDEEGSLYNKSDIEKAFERLQKERKGSALEEPTMADIREIIHAMQITRASFSGNRSRSRDMSDKPSRPSIASILASTGRRSTAISHGKSHCGPFHINKSVLMFGCVALEDSVTCRVRLTSTSDEAQRISISIQCTAGGFKVLSNASNLLLSRRESITLEVEFTPLEMSRYLGKLIVKSDKFGNSDTISLRGGGGCCSIRPVKYRGLEVTKNGHAVVTDAYNRLAMKIENTGVRRAFCAIVLMVNGQRISCKVTPSPYLILGRNETKEIIISTTDDFSSIGMDSRLSSQASTAPRLSSVSTSSLRSQRPFVMLLFGEDLLRQRLVKHLSDEGKNYEHCQVKFAAEQFTGNYKEDSAPEWSLSSADIAAFETHLRGVEISIHSTRGPRYSLGETLKPDETVMQSSLEDMTLVPDVTTI